MSSSAEKVRNKDITSFHRLCKDLYKFIQKRIIRKYVNPNIIYEPVNSLGNAISRNKEWKYFNTKEKISEEEKILDIFKDNAFLAKLKAYYESLETIINTLDENEKNVELLQKDIELGEKKLEMLSKLNTQLNQFFNIKDNNTNNNSNNNSNNSSKSKGNKNNVLDRIHLVKSLNILNELQFFNNGNNNSGENDKCIKNNNNTTSNTTITNNNNIILDNKIINNNIREAKTDVQKEKEQISLKEDKNKKDNSLNTPNISNKQKNKNNLPQKPKDTSATDVKLLNRKVKRDNSNLKEDEEIFSESSSMKKVSLINPNFISSNDNNIINESDNNTNDSNQPSPPPQLNNISNNSQNITNISVDKEQEPPKNNISGKVDNPQSQEEKIENNEKFDDQTNLEFEFEKVLKDKFSFVYNSSQNKIPKYKKDIMSEINSVLKRIPNLKYNRKEKFDDPYIVGSYSHFDVINLMDYVPPIDIMFKCKNIKSVKELKDIVDETMKKKMGFNYLEIGTEYDRKNEIVKYFHKCKVTKGQKDNNLFFFFNIIFVGINLSNFNQKETSINRFYFNNNGMYDNKGKILISLYFRKWRKKYKLSFMMPEFIDIIINYYYSDKNNLSFIIEEIFLALFNGHFRFLEKKGAEENDNISAAEDVENLKDIKKYILEWYENPEYKRKMSDAILDTQELIMNSKFYNTFNTEIDE